MNSEPTLDIIIGQSTITRNNFSSNYETQACAFPSGGFLSIISLKGSERHDIILSNTTTTISAISFSKMEILLQLEKQVLHLVYLY